MPVSLTTVDQLSNIFLSIVTMQGLKRMDMSNTNILWSLRIIYVSSQLLYLLLLYIIKNRIISTNDTRKLKVKPEISFFQRNDTLEEDEMVEISFKDYDYKEYSKILKGMLIQFLIVIFIHFKLSISQPLVIQSLVPFKSLFLNPLFIFYIRNNPILRPFEDNMLFQKTSKNEEKENVEKKRKKEE
ncbi:phosphate transporter (Pho88) [Hamiltosporidium tvaerminnensis]|uniref:Inorganic phosphate transport protein Pho88 n=2 Tax=Hamiltosporidium TaxID=1176354 RepID=A0A4V2JU42_9MICR|nr:phosphate transporter (Pho88) [Hamiltosporidium tvaerminnensis]TBT98761.1 inorganic phosphate transport protein Pho88 [Hamiltosporidium magnivora]